jgi:hypothetical protein
MDRLTIYQGASPHLSIAFGERILFEMDNDLQGGAGKKSAAWKTCQAASG